MMSRFHFGRFRRLSGDVATGLALECVAMGATWWLLDLPASYLAVALTLFGLLSGLVAWTHPGREREPGSGLGPANRVTYARGMLVVAVVALVPYVGGAGAGAYWWIILLSTVAMALDGVDGRVARRTGTATAFGARFDMELDAALLLGLSLLAWGSGKVGLWILLVGGMRYLFVGAGRIWPFLEGELPESTRRKTVCVVQGIALLVCLGPIIPSWTASAVGGTALVLLTYSFAVDVRWLWSGKEEERTAARPAPEG